MAKKKVLHHITIWGVDKSLIVLKHKEVNSSGMLSRAQNFLVFKMLLGRH